MIFSSISSARRALIALGVVASLAACSGTSDGDSDGGDDAPSADAGADTDDLL